MNSFLESMGAWYDPKRDGSIEDYIEYCRNEQIPKCFKGADHYQQLIDLGYVTPNITSIRIMYGSRGDEFYGVVDDYKLVGVDVPVHAGKTGIHDPKELLSNIPCFEIDMINPFPEKRIRD